MKIGVLSDTHGNLGAIEEALCVFRDRGVETIVHLGDGLDDFDKVSTDDFKVEMILGNNDFHHATLPFEKRLSFGGVEFLLVHGFRERLSRYNDEKIERVNLKAMAIHAKKLGASVVLFGHTHLAADFYMDGVRFMNPGSLDPGDKDNSCLVITVSDSKITDTELFGLAAE